MTTVSEFAGVHVQAIKHAEPCSLSFTVLESRRLAESLRYFIDSFADILDGHETARYEDLLYRLIGVPEENMGPYVEGRANDRG